MKNNGVVIFIISLVVIICIALFFVFYLREFEFSVLLDKNKINSYSSDIKIYINDDEGSYINIFSRQNRDEIIKCLGNIKIKRCLFNNEEYNGGLLININKDENKIALVVNGNILNINGEKYYFNNEEIYDKIQGILDDECKIQNITQKNKLLSNTSTLIYKDGESEVYKKLEYDDTQRLYFCFTTAAITDINVNDEMQKYTIAFNQVGKEATYDMYINGKQVIIISRDDDVKKIVSSEELNLEIIYLISQPIKFDEGLEFINIENTYIMPDMYLNGKKINGGFFPSGTYSLLRSVEDILKNEEGFVVKKNEELKISSNSNKIFPDYTLGVIFNDSLNKEVKVTRKSDGSFYFNAPDEVGEYLFYFDVYFFKDKKAGSYYFKLIVE